VATRRTSSAAPRRALEPTDDETLEPEPPAGGAGEPRELTFRQHVIAFVKEFAAVVVGAVIVASLLRGFVGQMFIIPSESMQNTLQVNDRVLVEKLSSIKRGQIVVFKDPGGWLTGPRAKERGPIGKAFQFIGILPDTSTEHLIKRVVGLPGDSVACCDASGRISVNDQPLEEESYLYTGPDGVQVKPSQIRFEVVVPAGRIFVLGDNRTHSRDSRCHLNDVQAGTTKGASAFVPTDLVVGRAIAVVWPLGNARRLHTPATFEALPAGKVPAPTSPQIDAGPEATC
jgi:signal peptidase I